MKNAEVSFTGFITTKITVPVSEHSTDPVGDAYREARRQLQKEALVFAEVDDLDIFGVQYDGTYTMFE